MVAVGRSLIGDPEWVEKLRTGRLREIRAFAKSDIANLDDWEHSGHLAADDFPMYARRKSTINNPGRG